MWENGGKWRKMGKSVEKFSPNAYNFTSFQCPWALLPLFFAWPTKCTPFRVCVMCPSRPATKTPLDPASTTRPQTKSGKMEVGSSPLPSPSPSLCSKIFQHSKSIETIPCNLVCGP